jgi:hypothetical protein
LRKILEHLYSGKSSRYSDIKVSLSIKSSQGFASIILVENLAEQELIASELVVELIILVPVVKATAFT